ncbi:MAG TPA: general secretion pathway protein GspE, partial [Lentisphaeria bacterium]|nr:general secretion pathway protein GspE [Lentisphaeria bacterium]
MNENTATKGDIFSLLEGRGRITKQQGEIAQKRMKREGIPAHQSLIELDCCPQDEIYKALSECTGLPLISLHKINIEEDAKKCISAKTAIHYKFVPLKLKQNTLEAAFSTPPSMRVLENLRLLVGKRIEPLLATSHEINMTLKSVYGLGAETVIKIRESKIAERLQSREIRYSSAGGDIKVDDESVPIISLVNQILIDALEMAATDIHIEPFQDSVKLRYRIDGMLQDIPVPDGVRKFHEAITSRLKIMADLNIAERRLPHDGRISVKAGTEEFDLRISIMPSRFGETICLRILNRK